MTGTESAWFRPARPFAARVSLPADAAIVDLEHRARPLGFQARTAVRSNRPGGRASPASAPYLECNCAT